MVNFEILNSVFWMCLVCLYLFVSCWSCGISFFNFFLDNLYFDELVDMKFVVSVFVYDKWLIYFICSKNFSVY